MATNKEIDGHVMVRRNSTIGGNAKICGFATVGHDLRVEGWLDAPNIRGAGKGLYASEARLNEVHPHPEDGWWALVGDTLPADLYVAVDGKWVATGKQAGEADIEFEQYVDALQAAQEKAESAEEASTQALRTANANTARIDDVEGDLSTLSTDYTTTKQYLLEAQNDIDILQSQMQAAQGEMSDIREECNNSIVGVTEQTDLKIAELRENAPVLSMAGIVNTIGEVGFSGRYATTYSHYFVNAESKFYYKPYGAEMPIVSPYPYNIAEGSMGNPSVMFALGDTLYRLDEHPSGIENQMIKYIDAEDLDNAEASMRAVVTAVDSKVDDVDTRTRILSEELNGGDIIVNINKEVGIEDGWFELDSAIANVPARYKYRCGLFITFLWQRPADGEKVWRTYQFKGCDSSGEQEEQWQDTSRWNQMADVRFVVENALARCSALEDSQREQDDKIAANTSAIENHEQYLELIDKRNASYINVHAELPDVFGEPGLIGNNIRNVAFVLSTYGDRYATEGLMIKFFGMGSWEFWRYEGGGLTDESHWKKMQDFTEDDATQISKNAADISKNSTDIAELTEAGEVQDARLAALRDSVTALQSGKQDKLVSSEDILVDANVLRMADIAKKKVFIDMWNAACEINGKKWGWYDAVRDDFLIYPDFRNGEGLHLTYEEAVKVYIVSHKGNVETAEGTYFGDLQVEALLPLRISGSKQGSNLFHFQRQVKACAFVDAANMGTDSFSFWSYAAMFTGCVNLEEIYGNFYSSGTGSLAVLFANCNKLREVRFYSIKTNFDISASPLLSLASFQHMLTRTDNSVAITITVHKDCYAKMTGDTTNAAAAALTEEEAAQWQQLLTDAVAKNITFATL